MKQSLGSTTSLPDPPPGWFDYGYAVLLNGDLALVRTERDIRGEYARFRSLVFGGEVREHRWSTGDWRVRLSTFDGTSESGAVEVWAGQWPLIDRLPDGRWVVAASRAEREEKNARIYAADGALVCEFAMGDGIEHVRCAPDGSIWAGYFDEGVGASPNADGSEPVSRAGLARFGSDGSLLWSFNAENVADIFMDACEALTVDGSALWCCPSHNGTILSIENRSVESWQGDPELFGEAIAVDGRYVGLARGLGQNSDQVVLLLLSADRAERVGELRLRMPLPNDIGLVQGRGTLLHIVEQGRWTKVSVADVRAAINI